MKSLLVVLALTLSGCAVVLPVQHDSIMFSHIVDTKILVDKLNCDNKDWNNAGYYVERLKVYAVLRNDPQADAIVKLEEALIKARGSSNKTFCESALTIQRARVDVIVKAWSGR